jgi:hypothetical protein
MQKLLAFITYDKKHYDEITNELQKKDVFNLASRLSPLEDEIFSQVGIISISKEGNLFTVGYTQELLDKMHALIHS